jgi:hypothetical protein
MARAPRRDDEDELDPVEAADVESEEEDDLDGFVEEDDVDVVLDDDDPAVLEGDDLEDDDVEVDLDEDEDDEVLAAPVFDDEDEIVAAVEADDDEEDEDVDGLREGEFVCRSCFMAKRESALADPERMLCRDCA